MVFLVYMPGGPGLFWFIGLIIVLYLLYPVIIYFTSVLRTSFRVSLMIISSMLLIGLMILGSDFNIFPTAQLYYYWIAFVMGIYAGYMGFTFKLTKRSVMVLASIVLATTVSSFMIFNLDIPMFQPLIGALPQQFSSNIWSLLVMIIALSISFPIARWMKVRSSDIGARRITRIARSTNAIYLLHSLPLFRHVSSARLRSTIYRGHRHNGRYPDRSFSTQDTSRKGLILLSND